MSGLALMLSFLLQLFQETLKNSIFTPAIHANRNDMPNSIIFRQPPPFTGVFCDMGKRIRQLEIAPAFPPAGGASVR